jgi:hypothetical protein
MKEFDRFGSALVTSGDRIVIGFRRNEDVVPSAGSGYVYSFDGTDWVEEQILTAPDAAPLDIFSDSVSISDDVIAVGSAFKDGAGPFSTPVRRTSSDFEVAVLASQNR